MMNDINEKIKAETEKRNEIINDHRSNYFVEAGAGAGKTYTIVKRIINQLKRGYIQASELVVITFTKKAAAELYDRIAKTLADELRAEKLTDEERDNLGEAMRHIDTMTVSTIHSFCRKLLSERAFDAKIPLDIPIVEPSEEKRIKQAFFEDWFLQNSDKGIVQEALNRSKSYDGSPGLWNFKETAFSVFEDICNKMQEDLDIFCFGGLQIEDNDFSLYAIIKTAVEAAKAYNEEKSFDRLSDDDLLFKSRELLKSKDACEYFARKYKCIYIDEFQDTDHIQKEFLWALACGGGEKLREGSLFVVGDAKQSIYRFRGAEPEIFAATRNEMQNEGAKTEKLSINYRSNKDIIDWVNGKYRNGKLRDTEEYEDMLCINNDREYTDDSLHGVYVFDSPNTEKRDEDIDAKELCAIIETLVNNKSKNIYDNDKNVFRPIRYSDFLVLVRTKTRANAYKKAFAGRNIPVTFGIDKDVSENAAIGRFVTLYSFLSNSYDKKSIAGAMIAILGKDFFKATDEQWEDANKQVSALYEYTRDMSAYGIAEYLSHRMDLLMPQRTINKARMISEVSAVRQMVDTVLASTKGSRRMLADAFAAYRNSMAKNDLPLDFGYNAVRFMNVHQAKGLEGNIVIIADIGAFDNNPQSYKCKKEYYPAFKENKANYKANYSTVNFDEAVKEQEKKARNAENVRLEYVTATRAREALIFMPSRVKKSWITAAITAASSVKVKRDDFGIGTKDNSNNLKSASAAQVDVIRPKDPVEILSEAQTKAVYMTINPSRMEKIPALKADKKTDETVDAKKTSEDISEQTDENDVFEGEGKETENIADDNILSSAVEIGGDLESAEKAEKIRADHLGTAMHRMFELTVNYFISGGKDKSKLPEYLKYAVNQALIEGMDDMGDKVGIFEKRLKAFAAEFEKDVALHDRIAKADTVYTELPFSFFVNKREAEILSARLSDEKRKVEVSDGDWVNGTADLVLVRDGVVTVLDYKSNKNKDNIPNFIDELRRHYKGQLALYAFAMEKMLGADIVETDIVNYQTKE